MPDCRSAGRQSQMEADPAKNSPRGTQSVNEGYTNAELQEQFEHIFCCRGDGKSRGDAAVKTSSG